MMGVINHRRDAINVEIEIRPCWLAGCLLAGDGTEDAGLYLARVGITTRNRETLRVRAVNVDESLLLPRWSRRSIHLLG